MKSILVTALLTGGAWAGINQWTNVGPESTGVSFLTFDPQDAATVYAGTVGGLFKSADGGTSWTNAGLIGWTVSNVVIDPQTPATLYAVTGGHPGDSSDSSQVFKSIDGGANWSEIDAGLPVQYCCLSLLAISPQNTAALYALSAGPGRGLFKSIDGGASWTATAALPGRLNFFGVIVDPQNSSTLYAAVQGVDAASHNVIAVYKSRDGGASWSESDSGLASPLTGPGGPPTFVPLGPLTIDPRNPGTVYATRFGIGVYKSTDGGASWRAANSGLPNQVGEYGFLSCCVAGAVVDPQNTSTLYAPAMNGTVYKSSNGGTSWTTASTLGLGRLGPLTINPHTGTLYTGAGGSGMLKSVDGGATWNPTVISLRTAPVPSLAIEPGALYARGLKSTDGGMTWFAANSGIAPGYVITALAADRQNPGTLYAGTSEYKVDDDGDTLPCAAASVSGIFKTTDGGMSWTETAGTGCVAAIAIDPQNSGTAYAGSLTSGVSKSIDGGSSWSPVNAGIPAGRQGVAVSALAVDPKNSGTVYAASGLGLFKSIDGGASWNDSGLRPVAYALAIDPQNTGTVFAATASGLFKSTDGGNSWRNLSSTAVYAVAIHPQISSIVYAGTDDGVSQSTDGGESWTAIAGGPGLVRVLMLDPQQPDTVYAGGPAGLFAISLQ